MSASLLPLSSSAFLGSALSNFSNTSAQIATSVDRLSSGNRLTSAGDDVAALSISARMQSNLVGLRQAQSNIAQGDSLLQTAFDALSDIGDILDRQKSLATQANSGSLTATERGFLQTEFAELSTELDRIATNTAFNDINLLDGTISGQNTITTTTTNATQATGSLIFTSITAGESVVLNNMAFTEGSEFSAGGSLQDTIDNLVTVLNNSTDTRVSGATYARSGSSTLTVTFDTGGELGNLYEIDQNGSSADFTTGGTSATAATDVYTLSGGLDNGLNAGSVSASGTIGDSLVTTQAQTAASSTLTFTGNATAGVDSFTIDDGDSGTVTFNFVASSASSTQITVGSTVEETIQNTISILNQYSGSSDFGIRNLEFEQDADTLIIRNRQPGNALGVDGNALALTESITNASFSNASLNNGTNTGINTTGVTNASFVGTITGFAATYNSADDITATVTVGDITYTAEINDTTPASDTFVRFNSGTGGYFDVEIASGGLAVTNSTTATTFASRIEAAFSTLTFAQDRVVSSFTGSGSLAGGSATLQTTDFTTSTPRISNITVEAPTATHATIEFEINGETYQAANIGSIIGANDTITLTSTTNAQNKLTITHGSSNTSIASSTNAATYEAALRSSFGLNSTGSGIDLQVGGSATDTININISSSLSNQLFAGVTPNIATQSGAVSALATLTTAINSLDGIVAEVGASQARLDYAAQNVQSTITNLDAARASLADTDIAEESTNYATLAVAANAAVSIIAQTNQLRNGLLGVLDFG